MNQLYPIIRRVRRPLILPDQEKPMATHVTEKENSAPDEKPAEHNPSSRQAKRRAEGK
mgnify:CR=1 FL=1